MPTREWTKGEMVVHAAKPEWGAGEVLVAEPVVHEGKACQRLTIRFSRAGTKTISTAYADLRASEGPRLLQPPSEPAALPSAAAARPAALNGDSVDPLAKAAIDANVSETLTRLPEAATDPFSSLRSRLAATLDLYKFTASGGSLLDWAAIQTGLADPLSRFSRHELEQWFQRFQVELDQHLKRLIREVRKQDPQAWAELTASAGPAAKAAIRRVDQGR